MVHVRFGSEAVVQPKENGMKLGSAFGQNQPVNFLTIERHQAIETSCSGFEKGELADRADSPVDSSV